MPQPQEASADPELRSPQPVPVRLRDGEARRLSRVPGPDRETEDAFERLDHAVNGLRRRRPDLSAGEPMWLWQKAALASALVLLAGAMLLATGQALFALAMIFVVPFFCVVALRTTALWHAARGLHRPANEGIETDPVPLPAYSVLVPLYDEQDVVPDLIAALSAIDYPAGRLEILLIMEQADAKTRASIDALSLPAHMTAVVVPEGRPRTKPRALNFALTHATGDLVVVYDAEDLPEPDQLRRAARMLGADPRLGCVQARLNVLNAGETWLTRQFAVEYTVLFDCLLPTLDRLGLPLPLGGTSNHFPGILAQRYQR